MSDAGPAAPRTTNDANAGVASSAVERRVPLTGDGRKAGGEGTAPAPPAGRTARRISSADLFRGDREIVVIHRAQEYRLRITRADKLLLTT